jgi:putative thioredoxin
MTEELRINNISTGEFEEHVIAASGSLPVLVDFWADWCQPCKMLAPVLEQLARESEGSVKIVKVNSDLEPQLSERYGVRALPTVKLFRHGEVVDEFTGVQPLSAIKAFLQPHLPRGSDDLLQQAADLAGHGDREQALDLLQRAVAMDSENYRLHPQLAELLILAGRHDEAEGVLKSLPANIQQDDAVIRLNAVLGIARTAARAPAADDLAASVAREPGNLDARYQLSAVQAMDGDYEKAMDNLLEIIHRDRSYRDDAARRTLVDIFQLLGNEGPLVKQYRGKLSSALN